MLAEGLAVESGAYFWVLTFQLFMRKPESCRGSHCCEVIISSVGTCKKPLKGTSFSPSFLKFSTSWHQVVTGVARRRVTLCWKTWIRTPKRLRSMAQPSDSNLTGPLMGRQFGPLSSSSSLHVWPGKLLWRVTMLILWAAILTRSLHLADCSALFPNQWLQMVVTVCCETGYHRNVVPLVKRNETALCRQKYQQERIGGPTLLKSLWHS